MNRRIASAVASIIGLIVVILAVLSATLWRPSSLVQAVSPTPDQPYVVTEPGVLGVVNSDVTVTASAPGQDVTVAVAQAADVQAWLQYDPFTSVSGLSSWTALSAEAVTQHCAPADGSTPAASPSASASADASATPSASVSPSADAKGCVTLASSGASLQGSDLWLQTATGEGSAQLTVDATDPNLVVIAATDGTAAAPTLSLQWDRNVATPWLIPGLILGGLLILVGVFGWVFDHLLRRADEERRRRAAERAARVAQADSTATVGFPVVTGDPDRPLTRRESREKERAAEAGEEWIDPRTGELYLAGELISRLENTSEEGSDDASGGDEDLRVAGVSRGAAIVPALDEESTLALRAGRELDDDAPFAIASDDEESDEGGEAKTAETSEASPEASSQDPAQPHKAENARPEPAQAQDEERADLALETVAEQESRSERSEDGVENSAEAAEEAQPEASVEPAAEATPEPGSAFAETRVFAPIEEDSVFGDPVQTRAQTSVQTTNEEKSE